MVGVLMSEPNLIRSVPVLPVSDLRAARLWYEQALGFETTYLHNDPPQDPDGNYAALQREGVQLALVLQEPPYPEPWHTPGTQNVTIYVLDAERLYAEVLARGVEVSRPLQREAWGAKAFALRDPSGNQVYVCEG